MFLEFAFVPAEPQAAFKPRKRPVQARSEATVSALFEASIQVLLAVGYRKFTTTRVAERAGVSVGSLYQYFPNRQALITAVIERYLDELRATIEQRCRELCGHTLDRQITGLVDAAITAKWEHIEVSRALHEPLADIGGTELVTTSAIKTAGVVAEVLRTCADASFRDVDRLALLLVISCSALLQAAVTDETGTLDRESVRTHMRAMVLGYLHEMRADQSQAAAE
jgi:AcrR family transcriptional regulator